MARYTRDHFRPEEHEQALIGIVGELQVHPHIDGRLLGKVLNRHPKGAGLSFSKAELIRGVEVLAPQHGWDAPSLVARLRMKPMRTQSGVVPVTVLTKPFPCPGRCVFCPSDVRMPKSYLSMEPGAQRAAQLHFDPYAQTRSRLLALLGNGHPIDKVELIILGGTWSSYSESYQRWFIRRCFDALNQLHDDDRQQAAPDPRLATWDNVKVEGALGRYNQRVTDELQRRGQWAPDFEDAGWDEVEEAHRLNEVARCRSVGLVIETRPDRIDEAEAQRLRRLGVTKVQLGYQSTDDRILELNQRGHDVEASRRATRLLRRYGFKLHGHYMLNLLGATPASDLAGIEALYADPSLRPDELKLYPCSLIETAELMQHYQSGAWVPYDQSTLVELLAQCLARVPRWCRVTRVIRDIPSQDIVVGNKRSNLREDAEVHADRSRLPRVEIRSREIRARPIDPKELVRQDTSYQGPAGVDHFLEWVDPQDHLAGFLRLFLPSEEAPLPELLGAAVLREVHVYGQALTVGEGPGPAQHQGLGRRLIEEAAQRAAQAGFAKLSVISAVGTRAYYRGLGFEDGPLYQHLKTSASPAAHR
ncbi:MAG: tRNA uridine(34) 5-carboxymethylaminomethyl modification radical SAM/GNAT enzyme Elp3 [Deltaproteobacteria bacterium]|nr:tRNA uridine(34) 5-carboxymethylaminomethyl modification radical SAM/GNAT enzyme Elp3 [Deltaproteobacteria bacterium]